MLTKLPWKRIIILAAGIGLYFLLGRLTLIHLPYGLTVRFPLALLALWAVVWGPVTGLLVALGGEVLLGLFGAGLWWSVIAAAAFYAYTVGFFCHGRYTRGGGFGAGSAVPFMLWSALACLAAWLVVCPALDLILYREALENLLLRGVLDVVSNAVTTAAVGTGLLLTAGNLLPWRFTADKPPAGGSKKKKRRKAGKKHPVHDGWQGGDGYDDYDEYDDAGDAGCEENGEGRPYGGGPSPRPDYAGRPLGAGADDDLLGTLEGMAPPGRDGRRQGGVARPGGGQRMRPTAIDEERLFRDDN